MLTGRSSGGSLDSASSQISPGGGISMSSSGTGAVAALSGLPPNTGASGAYPSAAGGGVGLGARSGPVASSSLSSGAAAGVQDTQSGAGGLLGGGARPAGGSGILPNVRITADVSNNAVLVYADQESQRIVEQTIRQI